MLYQLIPPFPPHPTPSVPGTNDFFYYLPLPLFAVGEDAVSKEAAELEMKKERYVQDLHRVLTGEGSFDPGYSFTLTPCHSPGSSRTLAYEKVESDIWVSGALRWCGGKS